MSTVPPTSFANDRRSGSSAIAPTSPMAALLIDAMARLGGGELGLELGLDALAFGVCRLARRVTCGLADLAGNGPCGRQFLLVSGY